MIREGDPGQNFYIVDQGAFEASHSRAEGAVLKRYRPGGYFGELALLHNEPRAASVACTSDGVLWALDRASFRHNLIGVRLRQCACRVHFLAHLSEALLEELADAMFEVTCKAGEVRLWRSDPSRTIPAHHFSASLTAAPLLAFCDRLRHIILASTRLLIADSDAYDAYDVYNTRRIPTPSLHTIPSLSLRVTAGGHLAGRGWRQHVPRRGWQV